IRYEFDDYVVVGKEDHGTATTIRDIKGRVNDALPVVLRGGKHDTIHPIVLSEFHVPRLERIQFISKDAHHVSIQYVAPVDLDAHVARQFRRLLDSKDAAQTTFEVYRVPEIQNDPATGKLRLVRLDAAPRIAPTVETSNVRSLEHPEQQCVHQIFEQQAHGRPDSLA